MKHFIIFCSMSHAEDYNFYNTNYERLIFDTLGISLIVFYMTCIPVIKS